MGKCALILIDIQNFYFVGVNRLNNPEKAAYLNRAGEVLETSMDDIELEIILDYYKKNRKYMED